MSKHNDISIENTLYTSIVIGSAYSGCLCFETQFSARKLLTVLLPFFFNVGNHLIFFSFFSFFLSPSLALSFEVSVRGQSIKRCSGIYYVSARADGGLRFLGKPRTYNTPHRDPAPSPVLLIGTNDPEWTEFSSAKINGPCRPFTAERSRRCAADVKIEGSWNFLVYMFPVTVLDSVIIKGKKCHLKGDSGPS